MHPHTDKNARFTSDAVRDCKRYADQIDSHSDHNAPLLTEVTVHPLLSIAQRFSCHPNLAGYNVIHEKYARHEKYETC